jgi:undecaprenyl-diphosphatase
MDIVQSIILGIIEGFTEFLPISSTGHLIVASELMGIEQDSITKSYEVIIQLAAILAVAFLYRDKFSIKKIELWIKLAISFFPLGLVGLLFHKQIKSFFTIEVVAPMFIIGGIVFLIVEYFYKEQDHYVSEVEAITYRQSIWIGVAQVFALVPGTSRAGSTIIGALLTGVNRKTSAEYSFLLAIPVMIAASGFDLYKNHQEFSNANWTVLIVGFVVSFLVAVITIKLFLHVLNKFTFRGFGIYRIIFGLLLLTL